MKCMVILTDFSEAAYRAAEYGCELAGCLGIKRIVLYHAYQPLGTAGTPEFVGINDNGEQLYLEGMEALALLHDRLKPMIAKDTKIDLIAEDILLSSMAELIRKRNLKEKVEIIVMGVSGKSALEKFLVGSTTTQVLKEGEWPVLVVPEDTILGRGIKTIALTIDLKEIDMQSIRQVYEFLDALPGELLVVNVEQQEREKYSPEMKETIADLHKLLKKYNPEFIYLTGDDVVKEILCFANERHASLIIAIHQKHGFLSSLFHKSVTKQLAYNSNVPLLALPVFG